MTPSALASILLPTFNRLDILPEVIDALERQRDAGEVELVIVDDGSQDGTAQWLAERRFALPTRILSQPNRGPAAARNAALAVARGELLLFLGDDMVPEPDWLASHRRAHAARGDDQRLAVLGHTVWHRRMRPSRFVRSIAEDGLQFGYNLIADHENVGFNFFYGSNLSLRPALLAQERFDEGFRRPLWEDIELGYRLSKRGMKLVYEPGATVAHYHPTNLRQFLRRQRLAGQVGRRVWRLHPELAWLVGFGPGGPAPRQSPWLLRWLTRLAILAEPFGLPLPRVWQWVCRGHYVVGINDPEPPS